MSPSVIQYSSSYYFHAAAVQMSFQQDAYTVTEASGAVTVCVTLAGSIVRNVSTTLFTMDVDAVGRSCRTACHCTYLSLIRRFSVCVQYAGIQYAC